MSKPTLHQFYLSLIPNLVSELFFFIPKNEIREDIIEKLDFLKTNDIFNKVYVIDYYQGPIEFKKGRDNRRLLLKESDLDKNMFQLLEKKSDVPPHEFNYVLDKYFELAECLFYITHWMDNNITQILQVDDTSAGIFYLQYTSYKKHFEILVKNLYPTKDIIPKGNFNALELIDTYFPDITSQYNISTDYPTLTHSTLERGRGQEEKLPPLKKTKKSPLITDIEAEKILLEKVFNLDLNKLK
ncbi:hypothetical protein [Confluentibacter flavum]|uniref:Uncharacterized protein n=1 Tax=Confluentibacter flavum TaxID=1909700 RepID=A0A2N3HHZ3_9FLAO|nr:hypothetical protein [Confluentibacter flavum]PKQ44524.1 hypothetical protein CSW08_12790 [Confluentibacter flavum]